MPGTHSIVLWMNEWPHSVLISRCPSNSLYKITCPVQMSALLVPTSQVKCLSLWRLCHSLPSSSCSGFLLLFFRLPQGVESHEIRDGTSLITLVSTLNTAEMRYLTVCPVSGCCHLLLCLSRSAYPLYYHLQACYFSSYLIK